MVGAGEAARFAPVSGDGWEGSTAQLRAVPTDLTEVSVPKTVDCFLILLQASVFEPRAEVSIPKIVGCCLFLLQAGVCGPSKPGTGPEEGRLGQSPRTFLHTGRHLPHREIF